LGLVVSNTSPIVNLAAVGRLPLLQELYGTILIPDEVFIEIAVRGVGQPAAAEIQMYPWFERRKVTSKSLLGSILQQYPALDQGEAEAIVLALEVGAERVLIDETAGRAAATASGLMVTGILGLLREAKQRNLLSAVKPVMDDLIRVAGFWIGPALYARVLMDVGE
jgi:predicted nucleic acid-binding protein